MATEPLTAERILEVTEDVLRKYGPAKATVVDVARALGVSHGSVYRHFRTKAALREAVTKRWLDRTAKQLRFISEGADPQGGSPTDRSAEANLSDWLKALFEAKRHKAGDDPELFATYEVLLSEHSQVVEEHIKELIGQLAVIVDDGFRRGEFTSVRPDPTEVARALFDATAKFHDPQYAPYWSLPGVEADFAAVLSLLLRGLRVR